MKVHKMGLFLSCSEVVIEVENLPKMFALTEADGLWFSWNHIFGRAFISLGELPTRFLKT